MNSCPFTCSIANQGHRKLGDFNSILIEMERLIFLIESDRSLRENITELLELEGYRVVLLTSEELLTASKNCLEGLVIFNALTLIEPVDQFIEHTKDKVSGIAALCSDDDDPRINEADIKIVLPFNYQELLNQLSDFMNTQTYENSDSAVYSND